MAGRRNLTLGSDVDVRGSFVAFVVGVALGLVLVYPALPASLREGSGPGAVSLGPVGGPLLLGVGLFVLFVVGVVGLNWLLIEGER
jgi:hypothetical protein